MKKILTLLLIALCATSLVFANGASEQGGESITVGILQDTTGATATLGR